MNYNGLVRWDWSFPESSLKCLTETWLQEYEDRDSAFVLDGFTLKREDRTEDSGKSIGGGVCAYISVYKKFCSENIEYMVVRPFYVPREFNVYFFFF